MSNVQIFHFENQNVRTATNAQGEIYFCLSDVTEILAVNRRSADAFNLDPKGVQKINLATKGGKQDITFINEPNLYRVIFRSNKAEAVKFQNWVFDDVLPSIRKTGAYHNQLPTISPHIQNKTGTPERIELNNAITILGTTAGLPSQKAHKLIHRELGVNHISELSAEQMLYATGYARGITEQISRLSHSDKQKLKKRILARLDNPITPRQLAYDEYIMTIHDIPELIRGTRHVSDALLVEIIKTASNKLAYNQ